jgi:hypothetical protein
MRELTKAIHGRDQITYRHDEIKLQHVLREQFGFLRSKGSSKSHGGSLNLNDFASGIFLVNGRYSVDIYSLMVLSTCRIGLQSRHDELFQERFRLGKNEEKVDVRLQ